MIEDRIGDQSLHTSVIDLPASKCTNAVGKEAGERSRVNEKGARFMTALVGQSLTVGELAVFLSIQPDHIEQAEVVGHRPAVL